MPKSTLLEKLHDDAKLRAILAWPLDFDLEVTVSDRGWFEVKPIAETKIIARDGTGGEFLFYGPPKWLIHVTSECQAGVIARSLEEGLCLMVAYPYWRDLLKFSGGGKLEEMKRVIPYLERELHEDYPDIDHQRSMLVKGLELDEGGDPIASLYTAVATLGKGIIVTASDGMEFGSLFNTFTVESNPTWRQA